MSNHLSMSSPYLLAHYRIDLFEKPILIGQICAELEAYMEQIQASSWAFITAYNPMSEVYPDEENVQRNHKLEAQIRGYHYLPGEGADPNGEWKPERSFCVFDISLDEAKKLAALYEQKAIVYGLKGETAQLITIAG